MTVRLTTFVFVSCWFLCIILEADDVEVAVDRSRKLLDELKVSTTHTIHTYIHTHTHTHTHIHMCTCTHTYTYATHIYIHVQCTCTQIHIDTHTCTFT